MYVSADCRDVTVCKLHMVGLMDLEWAGDNSPPSPCRRRKNLGREKFVTTILVVLASVVQELGTVTLWFVVSCAV